MEGRKLKKRRTWIIAVLMMSVLTACGSEGGTSQKEPIEQEVKNDLQEDQEQIIADEAGAEDNGAGETGVEENGGGETDSGQIDLNNEEGSLIYVRHEVAKDYNGADAVRIYFTYTNKSEETKTVQSTFYPQVFQNGVECEMTFRDFMETNEAEENVSKELMKDASLEVAFMYVLQDVTNPVLLKVSDHSLENIWDGIYQEQELALQ